jgi:serine/threonine protein kinase
MASYQYKHGDRPLEGYTIERAAGRGGFGEVYYAISDSGRQVALKAVQSYEQIELRGISHCMNLKSPHLVSIFDVKYNKDGRPFVVMEFVSGASLGDMLKDSPSGLGEQKAAFFMREIAKGLSYLHDCGIVHRDLKPSNIFYEDGYVKIGDYGLSKAISASVHSGQTITVGTVHYMAPEIGSGCYDRSIDIYAMGIILYEMLTGQVPYFGSSPAEILMKHITAEPDLTGISDPFATAIRKSLTKDPKQRYQTVQEMVEGIFGSEHVRNSVSQFSPESLSMVAAKAAEKLQAERKEAEKPAWTYEKAQELVDEVEKEKDALTWEKLGQQVKPISERVRDWRHQMIKEELKVHDPIDRRQRHTLGIIALAVLAIGTGMIGGKSPDEWVAYTFLSFMMMTGAVLGINWSRWRWLYRLEQESVWLRKLATGGVAILLAIIFSVMVWGTMEYALNNLKSTWLAIGILLCLEDWWKLTAPNRKERVALGSAIGLGALGFVASLIFGGDKVLAIGILAGTCLVVQIVNPYDPKAYPKLSDDDEKAEDKPDPGGDALPAPGIGNVKPAGAATRADKAEAGPSWVEKWAERKPPTGVRGIPAWVRLIWVVGFMLLLGLGLMLLIWAGIDNQMRNEEFTMAVSFGVSSLVLCLFCLAKSFQVYFVSWYRYLIKPTILVLCTLTIVISSVCLGNMRLMPEEELLAIALIVFPCIIFLVFLFLPSRMVEEISSRYQPQRPAGALGKISPFKRVWALILSLFIFIGVGGLQRVYVGKTGTGILWLLTGGCFGIGQIIDVIMILTGHFTDKYGCELVIWENKDELRKDPELVSRLYHPAAAPAAGGYQQAAAGGFRQNEAHRVTVEPAPRGDEPSPRGEVAAAAGTDSGGSWARASGHLDSFARRAESLHPMAFLLSFVGGLLLFAAIVAGLAMALHVPALLAAGVPDPEIAKDFEEAFGYKGWPGLLEKIGFIVSAVLMVVAASCMILARRRFGAAYMTRAALGMLGFILALLALSASLPSTYPPEVVTKLQNEQLGPALEQLFEASSTTPAVFAAIFFVLSLIVLVWPPRKEKGELAMPADAAAAINGEKKKEEG